MLENQRAGGRRRGIQTKGERVAGLRPSTDLAGGGIEEGLCPRGGGLGGHRLAAGGVVLAVKQPREAGDTAGGVDEHRRGENRPADFGQRLVVAESAGHQSFLAAAGLAVQPANRGGQLFL